jgi:hypothetical protein
MKPRLFVGSSSENLEIAYAVQENLEQVAEVTVWTQGVFSPSKYNLESLVDALFKTDFGVFIFAPDDITTTRGQDRQTVRDNVIFELGMFVGRLGRERSFILMPKSAQANLHLPSDLLGLSPATYNAERRDGNIGAALGPVCSEISRHITRLGVSDLAVQPTQPLVIEAQAVQVRGASTTEAESAVLRAMVAGKFNRRSLSGLSNDTGLSKSEINACITSLMKKGLVKQGHTEASGQPRWFPSEVGRIYAGALPIAQAALAR